MTTTSPQRSPRGAGATGGDHQSATTGNPLGDCRESHILATLHRVDRTCHADVLLWAAALDW